MFPKIKTCHMSLHRKVHFIIFMPSHAIQIENLFLSNLTFLFLEQNHHEYRIEIGFDNAKQKLGPQANDEENHKSKSGNFQGKNFYKYLFY